MSTNRGQRVPQIDPSRLPVCVSQINDQHEENTCAPSAAVLADRDHFQLGSLSHLLNAKAGGYQELPDWPEAAPDPSVRNVEVKESVRAVGTVTYRDTGGPRGPLQGPQKLEGSEGGSFPRVVPQRG